MADRRVRARVEGTVQGVGFRPYVHRLAKQLALAGYVLNDDRGVLLEVEGPTETVERFLARLPAEAPPLARVESVSAQELPVSGNGGGFAIAPSRGGGEALALVSPDVATCDACLAEMNDPADRRYLYPFLNCTDCGPRFTIVRGVPYDRPLTTMAGFEMCARCRAEYEDPADRRFHAEPTACPDCGPSLSRPLEEISRALEDGLIVAVKGLGGYHLACRADDEDAVSSLRARKHREEKPFALMAADLAGARALVELSHAEEELLLGRERPIVIARRRPGAAVARSVAPGSPDLGVMLPYTPLHHLLLAGSPAPLVMTSGNLSDEPIAYEDDDAAERLASVADAFLSHDRPIHVRTDDSVVRATTAGSGRPALIRRSRGCVPASLDLPVPAQRPLLACGAELKSTFCLAKGGRAWVSHHIGDLENWETLRSFREGVEHFERLFAVAPELVVHDLHPEYLSTKEALEREGVEALGVQHHHAHLAACLAEHGETRGAVGAIYDGAGFGLDGAVWGGELLVGGLTGYERPAHLREVRLPGGERAIREPWRMACAWLVALHGEQPAVPSGLHGRVDPARWEQVAALCASGDPAAPPTTSMGRLFDAVGALCGGRTEVSYEGQAAIELEAMAFGGAAGSAAYPLPLVDGALDAGATVEAVLADLAAGVPQVEVAARFHAGVAAGTAAACAEIASRHGLDTAVVSGGVFQNRLLLEATFAALEASGLRALRPERLPANDGGISYGQAAVGAASLAAGAR